MIRPVILCGGAGTRLWPLSRQLFPKQLLPLMGEQSLLQQTAMRLGTGGFAPAIVVSGEDQRFFIKRQLEEAGAPLEAILLEPVARNTSSAAALAAAWLESTGREELMLLLPADHIILDQSAFLKAIALAAPHAQEGAIVTFGAQPTEPNTQYGYIEADVEAGSDDGVFPIARFVEKPDAQKAAEYLASGRFYWNAGIFLLNSVTMLDEMRRFLPQGLEAISNAVANAATDGTFVRPEAGSFKCAENISIDHGIMEKTSRGMVVPVQMDWSDVGSWDAVWKLGKKDSKGNVIQGDVVALDTSSSLVRSERGGPLVATVGLNEIAIIAAADAVFVSPIERVSEVKRVVDLLKAEDRECVISPPRVERPWGTYESLARGECFQVKHIIVDPGERLSLQAHAHRSEHWIVVQGTAEVTIGDRVSILQENESTFIPAGTRHRLANPGKAPLQLVEIQCGSYLGEDDIERFEDEYGRVDKQR